MASYRFVLRVGLVALGLLACGGDDVDTESVPGRYVGRWEWFLGTGPISMTVEPSMPPTHPVRFYETSSFRPGFNEDGMTPDALGTLTVQTGAMLQLSLDLRTDNPPCVGLYSGPGAHDSAQGTLRFDITVVHDCADDGTAVLTFTKIADL